MLNWLIAMASNGVATSDELSGAGASWAKTACPGEILSRDGDHLARFIPSLPRDILEVRGDRAGRSPLAGGEYPMGDLLWPFVIVSFVLVVFLLVVSFIRIALSDHDSSAEPAATTT
jgi:hypothetical protein